MHPVPQFSELFPNKSIVTIHRKSCKWCHQRESVRCVDYEALLSCSYIITREHVAGCVDTKPSLVTGGLLSAVLIAKYADPSSTQVRTAQLDTNYHGCEPTLNTHLVLHCAVSLTPHTDLRVITKKHCHHRSLRTNLLDWLK